VKKEILVPLAVVVLSIAFVGISAMVVLSRGHPWCIKKKLRIGAVLLTLTGAATTGCGGHQISCYDPIVNELSVENQHYGGEITVDLSVGHTLSGKVD